MASIKQRPDGVWRARYRDDIGREHARHFKLKRDAQRWLDETAASVVTGQYVDPRAGRVTWSEWCDAWSSAQSWARGTREAAFVAVRSVPWVDAQLSSVRASQVQGWASAELRRGLAASTVRTRLNYVQMAFRAAVVDRVISVSPAAGVRAPRQRRAEVAMRTLTPAQLAAVLEAAGDFRPFVEVCAFAGLRLGEAAGLQLGDVSFLGRTLTVRRQVQGATIRGSELVPPKAGSERVLSIPDELGHRLSAHVAHERLSDPAEQLFVTPLGRLWNRNSAGEEWRRLRGRVGLPDEITLHTLRHTFASSLIASGCDVVTVQRALGHSQPSITLNVYAHLWPSAADRTRAAAAAFMDEVRGSADSLRTGTGKAQVSSPPYR